MAMHTIRYNRYTILHHTWNGRMDGHRMGTHISLLVRLTLRRNQRDHYRFSGRSTAFHRHHSYLHYHLLHTQTKSR